MNTSSSEAGTSRTLATVTPRCASAAVIDERHPAFPFADQDTFVNHFIADTVQTLRGEQAT